MLVFPQVVWRKPPSMRRGRGGRGGDARTLVNDGDSFVTPRAPPSDDAIEKIGEDPHTGHNEGRPSLSKRGVPCVPLRGGQSWSVLTQSGERKRNEHRSPLPAKKTRTCEGSSNDALTVQALRLSALALHFPKGTQTHGFFAAGKGSSSPNS